MSGSIASALPAPDFAPAQRVRLAALGVVPLRRRESFLPEVVQPKAPQPQVAAQETPKAEALPQGAPRLRVFVEGASDPFAGENAKLLRAILAAIGVGERDIASSASAKVPLLAFGRASEPADFRVAALSALRNPVDKRAAWKELRRLKRALAGHFRAG